MPFIKCDHPLSKEEYGRRQRAFCQFELHCRFFEQYIAECDPLSTHYDGRATATQLVNLFRQQFDIFELEEMAVIHRYLDRRLCSYIANMSGCDDNIRREYDMMNPPRHLPTELQILLGLEHLRKIFQTEDQLLKADLIPLSVGIPVQSTLASELFYYLRDHTNYNLAILDDIGSQRGNAINTGDRPCHSAVWASWRIWETKIERRQDLGIVFWDPCRFQDR